MMSQNIANLERRLRASVCAGRFADVAVLLPVYCAAVEAQAKQLPPGDLSLTELATRFGALADWTRLMLSIGRAECAAELQRFGRIQGYFGASPDEVVLGIEG